MADENGVDEQYPNLDTDRTDPLIKGRRIAVSDVIFAGDGDHKYKNFWYWRVEPEEVYDALRYWFDNRDEYVEIAKFDAEDVNTEDLRETLEQLEQWV